MQKINRKRPSELFSNIFGIAFVIFILWGMVIKIGDFFTPISEEKQEFYDSLCEDIEEPYSNAR